MNANDEWSVDDYEKIVDTLIYFGDGLTLDFCVELAYKSNRERKSFYSEYRYAASKYDGKRVINIKRRVVAYLALTQKPFRIVIRRSMQDDLQAVMSRVDKWFTDSKIFSYKENKLVTIGEHSLSVPFPNGGGLRFEPVVVFKDGIYDKGVRMYLNDSENFVDISALKFKEFYNTVERLEYYTAAAAVLSSINIPREEAQKYRIELEATDGEYDTGAFKNNKFGGSRANSFFDRDIKE